MKRSLSILTACVLMTCAAVSCGDSGSKGTDPDKLRSVASSTFKSFDAALTDIDSKGLNIADDKKKPVVITSKDSYNTSYADDMRKSALVYFSSLSDYEYVIFIKDYKVDGVAVADSWDSQYVTHWNDNGAGGNTLEEYRASLMAKISEE